AIGAESKTRTVERTTIVAALRKENCFMIASERIPRFMPIYGKRRFGASRDWSVIAHGPDFPLTPNEGAAVMWRQCATSTCKPQGNSCRNSQVFTGSNAVRECAKCVYKGRRIFLPTQTKTHRLDKDERARLFSRNLKEHSGERE